MIRPTSFLVLTALLLTACAGQPPSPGTEASVASASPAESSGQAPSERQAPSDPVELAGVRNCADVPAIGAPPEAYADEPIYVGNEMPTEKVQAWASGKPGFEGIWIDRDHFGWITVAFSEDAEARQTELDEAFPDDGVVAVEVDWTSAELEALQARVHQELSPLFPVSSGTLINYGVVSIGLGVLSPQRVAAVAERFGDDPVCVEGMDPAHLPPPGPQPLAGDGWRLIADERTGQPYRTGIAWDDASLRALWKEAGLSADLPVVDFSSEVVIWFGAVFGGGCPNIRMDDVVVDEVRRLVHAEIVDLDVTMGCDSSANPRAFVVALERSRLPPAPFSIQLGSADPPDGVPEERTVVDADLRAPGSVAAAGQVHGDPGLPEPQFVESGQVIEPDFEVAYRMSVHCGIEWLGELNGIAWRTEVPAGVTDFVPDAWQPMVTDETIVLSVLMEAGAAPTVTATANGHAVVYRPAREEPPGCD